ncbi:hypothetical protein [Kitasatospora phosalacinea]|uniref:Uncharacterized protein n=1 Tax=Kitasatospora phosalacinea TaxID=2065 RepID=A0A9W6URY1_9ACTN|nr:hypothetical protein [Kitasatospora phosalacinea]GLW57988.1 hypothetical protein Kpho01_59990 [Kitasatospora phosalacinea]
MPFLDHAHLTEADFAAFEQLLDTRRDGNDRTHPHWELVPGGAQQDSFAVFRPTGDRGSTLPNHWEAKVYLDEAGHILPEQPGPPAPLPPLATVLAAHLPGWSAQPCRLNPGRDLADLTGQLWGRHPSLWNSATAPHSAFALAGPGGERLLVVQPHPDGRVFLRSMLPDDAPENRYLWSPRPPDPVEFSADTEPSVLAAEVTERFVPAYQRAAWYARTAAVEDALVSLDDLSVAYVLPANTQRFGEPEVFESAAARDHAAWQHLDVLADQGPHILAGIRTVTTAEDRLDPVIGPQLRRLHHAEDALAGIREVRTRWAPLTTRTASDDPATTRIRSWAQDQRNSEAWSRSAWVPGMSLAVLAQDVTRRIGRPVPSRDKQVEAAVARTERRGTGFTAEPAPAPSPPATAPRRTR